MLCSIRCDLICSLTLLGHIRNAILLLWSTMICALGMDMTVTAPLDMGTGQQRYVVAYTLKQGIEKQPDILNAQKSTYDNIMLNSSLYYGYPSIDCSHFISVSIFYLRGIFFAGSESTHSFKTAQTVTTPPILRPDALFLSKSNYSPNANFVSIWDFHKFKFKIFSTKKNMKKN